MINDQPAHDTRRIPHEMRVVGKGRSGMRDHVQIGIVQDSGDTQDSWNPQPTQFAFRQPVQLGVQGAEQRIRGCMLTGSSRAGERAGYGIHAVPPVKKRPTREQGTAPHQVKASNSKEEK
jgi:hypothetical protein